MSHSNTQPGTWGNNIYPSVTPGVIQNSTVPSEGRLWGSKVRRFMGIAQIICGVVELAIGIAVICIPTSHYYDHMDYVGWGIWTGVFVIVTGFLGVYSFSSRCVVLMEQYVCNKCMIYLYKGKGFKTDKVISYMVCSIIAAVLAGGCCIYAGIGAAVTDHDYDYWEDWYRPGSGANMPLYIVMCITFFAQMVISILGASFTCRAVSSGRSQSQQTVYYTPQQMPPVNVPAPPYTVNAIPGAAGQQTNVPIPITNEVLAKSI